MIRRISSKVILVWKRLCSKFADPEIDNEEFFAILDMKKDIKELSKL